LPGTAQNKTLAKVGLKTARFTDTLRKVYPKDFYGSIYNADIPHGSTAH